MTSKYLKNIKTSKNETNKNISKKFVKHKRQESSNSRAVYILNAQVSGGQEAATPSVVGAVRTQESLFDK